MTGNMLSNTTVEREQYQDLESWCSLITEEPKTTHDSKISTANTMMKEDSKQNNLNLASWCYKKEVMSPSLTGSSSSNTPAISPATPIFNFDDNMLSFEEKTYDFMPPILTDNDAAAATSHIENETGYSNHWNDILETLKNDVSCNVEKTKEPFIFRDSSDDEMDLFKWDRELVPKMNMSHHSMATLSCDDLLKNEDFFMNKNGEFENNFAEHVQTAFVERKNRNLCLNVNLKDNNNKKDISTPEVLNYVEELEAENQNVFQFPIVEKNHLEPVLSSSSSIASTSYMGEISQAKVPSRPIKSEPPSDTESDDDSRFIPRHQMVDSDDEYVPKCERLKKYRKRKPSAKVEEVVLQLEVKKAKRGRPPKVRDSCPTSAYNTDDNASTLSTEELRYRELRNKNNEASKRSRMNRKLKEMEMEQIAVDLEARNKQLRVKAEVLEDLTKRLKDALMMAILNKK